jgi:hypothetical protein
MDLKLGDNQYTTIRLDGLCAVQEQGMFQSPPKWVCSDTTVVKITPDEDGRCCRIEAAKPPLHGTATVTVTDRDNSSVPAVIFNITITKDPITSLNICIDPATELGQLPAKAVPPVPEKHNPPPPPKGAVQASFGEPEQPKP